MAVSLREDGDKAFERGDYTAAAACYAGALRDAPDLGGDPAFTGRLARAKAGASCEAARRLMAGGRGLSALDEARSAVRLAPDWDVPGKLLPLAEKGAAAELVARAKKKLAQADLAGADQDIAAALVLVADAPGAADLRAAVARRRAEAAKAADAAALAMAVGAWDKAEAQCQMALDLDATPKEMKARLDEIFLRRAEAQVKAGHAGAALVGCRRGAAISAKARERAGQLLAQLRREEMPRFRWSVEGPQADLVARWLAARGFEQAVGARAAGQVAEVKVRITAAEARLARVASREVATPWFEERSERNPEFDAVEVKLAKAEEELAKARLRMEHARASDREAVAAAAQTWEDAVRELAAERNTTPPLCVVRVEHAQVHTEEEWRATGRLAVRFVPAQGDPVSAEETFDKSDRVRLEDGKGGARRGPDLPDEAGILADLGRKALDKVLPPLVEPAILARVARLRHDAAKAAEAGDKEAELELRARAAVLLGAVSAELGEKELKKLE